MAFNYADWVYPCTGRITSLSGGRIGLSGKFEIHGGLDIANKAGTPIYAACDGTVGRIGGDPNGYGNHFPRVYVADHILSQKMKNEKSSVLIYYGHCSKSLVKEGDKITKGQQIALMGDEGHSSGPHLHFEMQLRYANGGYSKFLCDAIDPAFSTVTSTTSSDHIVKPVPGASITALVQWYNHQDGSNPTTPPAPPPPQTDYFVYDNSKLGTFLYIDYKDTFPETVLSGYIGRVKVNSKGEVEAPNFVVYDGDTYFKIEIRTASDGSLERFTNQGLLRYFWVKRSDIRIEKTFAK